MDARMAGAVKFILPTFQSPTDGGHCETQWKTGFKWELCRD